jgi:hypothetical protein
MEREGPGGIKKNGEIGEIGGSRGAKRGVWRRKTAKSLWLQLFVY